MPNFENLPQNMGDEQPEQEKDASQKTPEELAKEHEELKDKEATGTLTPEEQGRLGMMED